MGGEGSLSGRVKGEYRCFIVLKILPTVLVLLFRFFSSLNIGAFSEQLPQNELIRVFYHVGSSALHIALRFLSPDGHRKNVNLIQIIILQYRLSLQRAAIIFS